MKAQTGVAEAAEKTGLVIRGLQSRLQERASEVQEPPAESATDLENQLKEYFDRWPREESAEKGRLSQIRNRVLDAVADRILRRWERSQEGKAGAFENEVIERLTERVLEKLTESGGIPGPRRVPPPEGTPQP